MDITNTEKKEANIDRFLEIMYDNQRVEQDIEINVVCSEIVEQFENELKKYVSKEVYDKLENLLLGCYAEICTKRAVDGMKMAICILDGTYKPFI